ncbi:hypothetical protein C7S20_19455 [Christiangramia fulva]|uniref:Uncharacterized protein n=1 Tax=Christiangramia fulva TaxID=2126553 RepID=A0A2R3ZAB0_9FLAO|nr:hypothetical protein C7S20_19455 [Christiangramia fulva]
MAEGLRTAYQLEEDDIATILPEEEDKFNGEEFNKQFLQFDRDRIQKINQKGKEKFEQGYSKAKKEVLDQLETEARERFGVEDDELRGIDLIDHIVEINSKKSKADPTKLTEEQIKSHPSVIKLLNEKEKSFKTREEELKTEYDTKLNNFQKERTFSAVEKKALAIFDKMNPVLSSDPERAANQKSILINDLKGLDYQEDGDTYIPLQEGKRLEDPHGNGVSFEKLVQSRAARYFDFKKAEERDTPPAGGGDGGATGFPKTEAEYAKIVNDQNIPLEERLEIKKKWNEAKSQS